LQYSPQSTARTSVDKIIVEIKSVKSLSELMEAQLINYLGIAKLQVRLAKCKNPIIVVVFLHLALEFFISL
jgi:hypothetical protein